MQRGTSSAAARWLAAVAAMTAALMAVPSTGQQPIRFSFYGMGDWDGDGHADIVARNATGDLMLYPGEGKRGYSSAQPVKIGNGWGALGFYGLGDWDGDGHKDIVARNAQGDLMLYPGEGRRGYSNAQPVKIGNGWNALSYYGMGDWDGDGHLDIVARNAQGDLMLYPGEGKRGYSSAQPVKIGNGWGALSFYGMGDWDGDGHLDIVARNAQGDLMLYPGEGKRGYSNAQPVKIGNGWNALGFFGMADWDGDGHLDIVARNAGGDLMLYPGEGRRGYSSAQPVKIGNGW